MKVADAFRCLRAAKVRPECVSQGLVGPPPELQGFDRPLKYRVLEGAFDTLIRTGDAHPKLQRVGMRGYGEAVTHLYPKPKSGQLENFGRVDDGVSRGGVLAHEPHRLAGAAHPVGRSAFWGPDGLKAMRDQLAPSGPLTIFDFSGGHWDKSELERLGRPAGVRVVTWPMRPWGPVPPDDLLRAVSAIRHAQAEGGVLFHCVHGNDRTGAVAAAWRMAVDGWSLDRALQEEMTPHGFDIFKEPYETSKLDSLHAFADRWDRLTPAQREQALERGQLPAAG